MHKIQKPYLLFLGDANREYGAKTAQGVLHWVPDQCVGQFRLPGCEIDLGIADMDFEEAYAAGGRTVLLGVANRGGVLPDHWVPHLIKAVKAGFDVAAGLHVRLNDLTCLKAAADKQGRTLHDVRHWSGGPMPLGTGRKRSGHRALIVGTDCAVGKKFTALAVHQALVEKGVDATFRPTGQTGALISGYGCALDTIPGDFISGVAEALSPDNDPDHWDVIEGQATVLHPTFAAVTIGLVHGSQPDAMIVSHDLGRTEMRGLPGRVLPTLLDTIDAHERAARVNNPKARCVAISVNTSAVDEDAAQTALAEIEQMTGLPSTDPIRFGADILAKAILDTMEPHNE
ncbi:MAG: DUF1611 domain-containing protein [Pseudomonadota bacterium]